MTEFILNIGDIATSGIPARYTCFGLGSCIGLFIQDRVTGLSGGAHIMLAEQNILSPSRSEFYYAKNAVDELLSRLKSNGSDLMSLRAKLTGGANVTALRTQMGVLNSKAVIHLLQTHKIYVAAMDVGGPFSRTATFDSTSGCVTVRIPEINQYRIL